MDALQKCSQCLEIFNEDRLPLGLSSCPHYICQSCLSQALGGTFEEVVCGFCSASVRKEEIVALPAPPEILLNSSRRLSCIEKETSSKCEVESEGVLLECDEEAADATPAGDGLCRLHSVPMDIVCISDKERICPHCALFGNHKDHRFKRIQDFEKETKEKMRVFDEISAAKDAYYRQLQKEPANSLEECLRKGKSAVKEEICQKVQSFIKALRSKEQRLLEELETAYQEVEQYCRRTPSFKKRESVRMKLDRWEEECQAAKKIVLGSTSVQKKISHYYSSALQIASEGSLFLEELKLATQASSQNMSSKIKEVRLSADTQMESIIDNCMKLQRVSVSSFIVGLDFGEEDDRNSFMDCSEIGINSIDTVVNNSIEVDISSLSHKAIPELTKTVKKPISKQEIKSLKSIDKKEARPQQNRKKLTQSPSKLVLTKQSRVSEISSVRSPSKILSGPSLKEILPGVEIKSSETKEPEKIYNEFSKNTLTDFFDISDCNLPSERVVEYVHRARRIHKIRGLKLSSNHLNTQGFQKMLEFLKGVGNINLANNEINEGVFDLLLKNRDRVDALKIINLSHNPINFEKKTSSKIEELKRMGVIVIL